MITIGRYSREVMSPDHPVVYQQKPIVVLVDELIVKDAVVRR